MTKSRINLYVQYLNSTTALLLYSGISSRMITPSIFENFSLSSVDQQDPKTNITTKAIIFDCRFNSSIERDKIFNWAKDSIISGLDINRFRLTSHDCSHDDLSIKDCSETNFVEFIK